MNDKTLRLLELETVQRYAAECSKSEEAANIIISEKPRTDPGEVESLKKTVAAILERIRTVDEPVGSLPSIGFLFPKLGVEGAALEIDEVFAIGVFVEQAEQFVKWLEFPDLRREVVPDCAPAAREIFRVLTRDGKLRDLPEFRAIRRRIQHLQSELETASLRYTGNDEVRRMLQSAVPSQRDGRMVLAVKANYRGRVKGIVHEVSATGQTVFIEPEEVVEKNNDILIEQRRLDSEIVKVLRELTAKLSAMRGELQAFHAIIINLECAAAKARYAARSKSVFAQSGTGSAETDAPLVLKQARHPLLGSAAVPVDIAMDAATRTVIITGPNTGGKTVALKTVGLFAAMNQCGMAVPATEGSALPVFGGMYADIGDEQSISQSLSTFSAHMKNIADIVRAADASSLILLDELGSGTDPEEGGAIAMALLDRLIAMRCRLIVTTHHGVLKNYGYSHPGVENASMEFDGRTLSPTYRIVMGVPGESRAVEIAGRNGLPQDIVDKARAYLDEGRSDVSALITSLKDKHRLLDSAAGAAKAEELRLREERRRSDLKELRLRQKELEIKTGAAGNLRGLLAESRKTLENLVRELREGELTREKTLRVKEFLRDLETAAEKEDAALDEEKRLLDEERRNLEHVAAGSAAGRPLEIVPGAEVLAGPSRSRGRVLRKDRKGWIVEIGSLKMSFPETELQVLPPSGETAKPVISTMGVIASEAPRFELSLRGMRLEEALDALRRQIDAAMLSGLKQFAVVHGKGEGVLQKGVHDYLKHDSAVSDYYFSRPEQGGFGRTEVILKN